MNKQQYSRQKTERLEARQHLAGLLRSGAAPSLVAAERLRLWMLKKNAQPYRGLAKIDHNYPKGRTHTFRDPFGKEHTEVRHVYHAYNPDRHKPPLPNGKPAPRVVGRRKRG